MRTFTISMFLLILLSGCTQAVNLEAAEDSNNPNCADVSNAQATAAWGNPAAVLLRCGLETVEVSTLPCVTAGTTDWLVDESDAPKYRFISYATFPAVEVIVDSEVASGISTLEGLSQAMSVLPRTKVCTTLID
jgi:uncharacterized protein YceK